MKAIASICGLIIFCTSQEHITCFWTRREPEKKKCFRKCCVAMYTIFFFLNIWQLFEARTLTFVFSHGEQHSVCHRQHFLFACVHFFVSYECSKVTLLWAVVCTVLIFVSFFICFFSVSLNRHVKKREREWAGEDCKNRYLHLE